MTVPVGCTERERPCKENNVVTVKRVKGHLLRREESYTEASMFQDNNADAEEDADNVELMQYTLMSQRSSISSQKPKAELPLQVKEAPSPSVAGSPALRRNVRAWCDASGLPTTVTIRCEDRAFHLHKLPLVSRSGYLKRALKDLTEITLNDVPGGPETFEVVSNFCYGSTILMEPANVAELCCLASYLQMTEDYGRSNLCERSELYLTQVALQSWDDTLVVLEHCERLAPYAEQLGVVRRCLEALAFMACMELLDPAARENETWWVQGLMALPPSLFVKLVLALRREGMQENYVGQVITAFADRWIFGLGEESAAVTQKIGYGDGKYWAAMTDPAVLIDSVVGLLPLERCVVPIGFLFALLRRGLASGLNDDCRIQLETRIVLQLENATLHDVLLPGKKEKESRCVLKNELESMERILKLFLTRFRAFDDARAADMAPLTLVATLWDEYLAEIAFDLSITPARFTELVERIPAHMRLVHDDVYRAIHTYLKAHPSTTQEERLVVCRTLQCQKLSLEACAHAVQNDLMPLRMIVQAMFMQQQQTRSVLNSHLDSAGQSFRDHPESQSHGRSILQNSAPLSSHPSAGNSGRHRTCEYSQDSFRSIGSSFRDVDSDLYIDDVMYVAASHNMAAKKEIMVPPPKSDYHVTETRLRSLEAELSRMRKTLSQSLIDNSQSRHEPRRQAAAASSSVLALESQNPKIWINNGVPMTSHSGRSGQLSTPCKMATVHEGGVVTGNSCGSGSGCMSQLKPVNGTTGLLAKTLQRLKFRGFGKATKSTDVALKVPVPRLPVRDAPKFESDMSRLVARTDSMPRPATRSSQAKSRHARHNSMS